MSDIVMKHYGINTGPDIVERLRDWQKHLAPANSIDIDILTREAAAEIERLRHPKIIVGSRKLWEAMGEIVSEAETERLTDIVERLRDIALIPDPITTAREAADEIERLRAQVHDLTEAVNIEYVGSVAQARNAALEEAAKVAEAPIMGHVVMPQPLIAAAIRALKGDE